jgi:hypothetical protein
MCNDLRALDEAEDIGAAVQNLAARAERLDRSAPLRPEQSAHLDAERPRLRPRDEDFAVRRVSPSGTFRPDALEDNVRDALRERFEQRGEGR